ncbi:hypothetical protein HAHE_30180 [Haloferula helveola]|uniref:Uncharacterized protein n=1 Tax=Haloferula helveola TaxID=490095 RepID=A0ABM7RG60_9BACT|nr:hypothetical protein HAHE_30180 [Haloferula helveola]
MKPATLPILCGTALAIMAGAAGSHYASVNQLLAFAGMTGPNGLPSLKQERNRLVGVDGSDTNSLLSELKRQNREMQSTLAERRAALLSSTATGMVDEGGDAGGADMQLVLAELRALNDLRTQIAETNRDLMELRFQVDTHSDQFRPLNTVEEPIQELDAYDTSIGVLPPLDLP